MTQLCTLRPCGVILVPLPRCLRVVPMLTQETGMGAQLCMSQCRMNTSSWCGWCAHAAQTHATDASGYVPSYYCLRAQGKTAASLRAELIDPAFEFLLAAIRKH